MGYYLRYDKDFNMGPLELILWDKGLEKCVCVSIRSCNRVLADFTTQLFFLEQVWPNE